VRITSSVSSSDDNPFGADCPKQYLKAVVKDRAKVKEIEN